MKRVLVSLAIAASVVATAQASHKQEILQIQFRQMAEACQLALDGAAGATLPKGAPATLSGCYAHKVKTSFREARWDNRRAAVFQGRYLQVPRFSYGRDRQHMLRAAITAEPSLASTAYTAALQGRMNPYQAYNVASAALPNASASFGNASIAYGADPSRIAEATAAGSNTGSNK